MISDINKSNIRLMTDSTTYITRKLYNEHSAVSMNKTLLFVDKSDILIYNNLRIIRKLEVGLMAKYNTEQRKLLQNLFESHPHEMFSAGQISEMLNDKGISQSAVYRNLSMLEENGLLRRCSKQGSREILYQYTGKEQCRGHIHLSCKKCGKTVHMDSADSALIIDNAKNHENFLIDQLDTVLYGVCKGCQNK